LLEFSGEVRQRELGWQTQTDIVTVKILYVVPYTPTEIRVRPYNLIRQLSKKGHQVTVATVWSTEAERAALVGLRDQVHQIWAEPLSRGRSICNCLIAIPSYRPLQSVFSWQPALARRIRSATADVEPRDRFDVLHLEHLRGARYGLQAPRENNRKLAVVWDSVDCISLLFSLAAKSSARPMSRWIARFELGRTRRMESELVHRFDRTLVTSERDLSALASLAADDCERLSILGNGVDLDHFSPGPSDARSPKTIVISGKMSYHANISMVLRFITHVWPFVRRQVPNAQLWIVGKDPSSEIAALESDPQITVTGEVKNVADYLRRAEVAVAPIVYGVGIQNKVLEAMACGTPVVVSPQGSSSLAVKHGLNVIVAEDDEAFRSAVVELLQNPRRRNELGAAARRYVERDHGWDRIASQLENLYNGIINDSA